MLECVIQKKILYKASSNANLKANNSVYTDIYLFRANFI
jgi:hypothetical protein